MKNSHSRLSLVVLFATAVAASAQVSFEDRTEELGATFVHQMDAGTFGMSGGAGASDFDGDGDDDLFCVNGNGEHLLLRNDGGSFTDITAGSGVRDADNGFGSIGVIVADYDDDGRPDIFVTRWGTNSLFRNLDGATFEEVTDDEGVGGDGGWGTSASFADFDRNGSLDLYVGNYIFDIEFPYHRGHPNELFVNHRPAQASGFTERAAELGVDGMETFTPLEDPAWADLVDGELPPVGLPTAGCTLSVNTLDYDEDGDPDLMVGNDFGQWTIPDRFYRNDFDPATGLAFTNITEETDYDIRPLYNMGINGADYDHDGDWDFYQSNLGDNTLLRWEGDHFVDATYEAGPVDGVNDAGTALITSWGSIWGDFDNDGWEDLIVVNGYIPAAPFIVNDFASPNTLWWNQHDGTFVRAGLEESGMADTGVGRGVVVADFDDDGWLDHYVVNNALGQGPPGYSNRLFMNQGGAGGPSFVVAGPRELPRTQQVAEANGSVTMRLVGTLSNVEGIGARVEARAGDLLMKRQVLGDPIYLSSASRLVHFGLGQRARLARVVIDWPSGVRQGLLDVPAGSKLRVPEPRIAQIRPPEPLVIGDALWFRALMRSWSDGAEEYELEFEVYERGGEAPLATATRTGVLGAGQYRFVHVMIPRPAGSPDRLEIRTTVRQGDATDARRTNFVAE